VTVLYSLTRPFSQGSFFSALADIAGAELLDQASTIEATNLNLAIIVGPALAGALAGIIGAAETVELQAALTVVVAALVAVNPAFEARPVDRPHSVAHALRTGLRALAQVMTTVTSISQLMLSAGAALCGAIHDPVTLIVMFVVVNLIAAAGALSRGSLTATS
jgi:hypothetical protein